jgi:hypothetical protein
MVGWAFPGVTFQVGFASQSMPNPDCGQTLRKADFTRRGVSCDKRGDDAPLIRLKVCNSGFRLLRIHGRFRLSRIKNKVAGRLCARSYARFIRVSKFR